MEPEKHLALMNRNSTPQQTLQRLPKKWAVGIIVALIVYALVQPFANSRFGWSLPSVAGVLGMEKQDANKPANKPANSVEDKNSQAIQTSSPESELKSKPDRELESVPSEAEPETKVATAPSKPLEKEPAKKNTADTKTSSAKSPAPENGSPKSTESKSTESKPAKPEANSDLLYGLLKDTGREVYVSPAGLRYTRGSEEGHRLKHIEKHLKDIPDRPGKHGVFDGDMAQVLRWIDDAYTRGKQGAKGVRKREENGRTVYEVPFTKSIGYIGGRDGKRDKNPDAKRLRLVVDGDQVITAFPF